MRDKHLHDFSGMPNVEGKLRGPQVSSISAMLSLIRRHPVVAAAGDHGSIIVYIGDGGNLYGQFTRWRSPVAEMAFTKKHQLKPWLKTWWPKMRDGLE